VNDKGVEQPTSSGEATPGDKPKPTVKASAEFSDSRLVRLYRS
jgi:hypothetical protein